MSDRAVFMSFLIVALWGCGDSLTQARPVGEVEVIPSSASIAVGDERRLVAQVRDLAGNELSGRPVSWSSSNEAVAPVTEDGLVTGNAVGAATITATSEGESGTAQIVVDPRTVATVEIQPSSATIETGETLQLTAVTRDAEGDELPGRAVTWSTSDESVASVSQDGEVSGNGVGPVTITATSEGRSGTAAISVEPRAVASVEVDPESATIETGGQVQLSATVRDGSGGELTDRTVTWSSSDGSVASVTQSGLVTGNGVGSATITATSGSESGTASITVEPVPVASVEVDPGSATIQVDGEVQLTATVRDADGNELTGRTVTWSTSDGNVASVTQSGLVTGEDEGSATITATSEGESGTASITVEPPPVASVEVEPESATIETGEQVQLSATVRDADGDELTDRVVFWETSDGAVASVTQSGLVTGEDEGSATITATSEGESGTASITVEAPPPEEEEEDLL